MEAGSKNTNSDEHNQTNSIIQPPTQPQAITCPQCGSTNVICSGKRYNNQTIVQRYLCKNCYYRFSDPKYRQTKQNINSRNMLQHAQKIHTLILNSPKILDKHCQWSDETPCRASTASKAAKTLDTVDIPSKSRLAGGAKQQEHPATTQAKTTKILEYAWTLKKQGYAETTIEGRIKILKRLQNLGADLYNPESVKEAIAKNNCSEARKELMVEAYSNFLLFLGGKWEPPKYRRVEKIPFIPTEREIDDFIAGCSNTKRLATYLQLLKETGIRSGEASKLKWTDIDFENAAVRVTPEKGSNPRILKISSKLMAMLNALPKDSTTIFPNVTIMRKSFVRQRARLAIKLQNPRLRQITFHTFRHWKATMEYAKTRDILHVMRMLGHKNIKNTLIYTQLIDFKDDEFICKAAIKSDEAKQLIELGFEYVCTATDGVMLFRKRK